MNAERFWWIHPGKLTLFFVIPIYLFTVYLVPAAWPHILVLKGTNFLQGPFAMIGLVMLGLHGLGGLLGARIAIGRPVRGTVEVSPLSLAGVGAVTILAYAIWFFPALLHPGMSLERSDLNRVAGITSFGQMGVPFVVCYLYCQLTSQQAFSRLIRFQFWTILLLTVIRVFLWRERLAAIELFVPAVVVILIYGTPKGFMRRLRPVMAIGGPYLAIPALIAVFTLTEYFRSWKTYAHTQSLSLVDFMTSRVVTYYFTALNNGVGLLATRADEWPTYKFLYTADWFYRLPAGIGSTFYTTFIGHGDPGGLFLTDFADPEFNNMSGIFPLIYDMGILGAGVYFLLFGFASGVLYRDMLRGRRLGGMFYPSVFVGCLEILRGAYLNGTRVVLIFAGAVYLCACTRRRMPMGAPLPAEHEMFGFHAGRGNRPW